MVCHTDRKTPSEAYDKIKNLRPGNLTGSEIEVSEDHMLSILFVRRARNEILGGDLFSDPAWDILLELLAAHLGHRSVSLEELAQATETPLSTTERWVSELNRRGLTELVAEPAVLKARHVRLAASGLVKMKHLARNWVQAFVSV